ncbi:MAG: hypothetical protein JSW68_15295 [Burkholderiales bacterium]|nr:MAG: hypothetical protein JSW68_15295 [Burkholderiales bacterium]
MSRLSTVFMLMHLIGLALGIGVATVKVALVLGIRANEALLPAYLQVAKVLTRHIVLGLVLLTLSGLGWMLLGYPLTARLATKLVLVALVWLIGPVIDMVVEPRMRALAPVAGVSFTPAYASARNQYLALELVATGLFYAIVVLWVIA